ncbi:MAG TPA: AsmA-like C-terminal region-containing protein [Bacteroidia bacterium]|nr:AsmA-like C-terminal region-containing protein [Bacteroidia bacterium]
MQAEKKKRSVWKRFLRLVTWTFGLFIFLFVTLLILTYAYQDEVKGFVLAEVNKRVNTTIIADPEKIDITIIRSFPDVSVVFTDLAALDATNNKKRDTLFVAQNVTLAFNILDLFHGNYSIHNLRIENGRAHLWMDEKGKDNFHFLKESVETAPTDTAKVSFALELIELKNIAFVYEDRGSESTYDLQLHTVAFSGDFGEEKFEISSEAEFTINALRKAGASFLGGNIGAADLVLTVDNIASIYNIETCKIRLSDLNLDLKGKVKEEGENYLLDLVLNGEEIDLPSALSLLPQSYRAETELFESSGGFYFTSTMKGLYGDTSTPLVKADFGVSPGATIGRKDSRVKFTDVSLKGNYSNENGKDGLKISAFKMAAAKSSFSGSFSLRNFSHPVYDARVNGKIDLGEMRELLQPDTIEAATGTVDVSFTASGRPEAAKPTAKDFRKFTTSGKISCDDVMIHFKGAPEPIDSIFGALNFSGNNVTIDGFTARTAGCDISLKGVLKNFLGFLFTENEVLEVTGNMASENLDLTRLLADEAMNTSETDSAYRLELPDRLKLNVAATAQHINLDRFEATGAKGNARIINQRLYLEEVSFNAMEGTFDGHGMIDASQRDSLLLTCSAEISGVNISKLFWQLNNFGLENDTLAIRDQNIKGKLTSQVEFASVWGKDLQVNENKIYADAEVRIDQGELMYKPLEILSRFIRLEDLKHIKFNTLTNHITIKNREVILPKMDLKSTAVNVTMSGTHDFDNIVNYHFIVDMDELRWKKAKAAKKENSEFGEELEDGGHRTRLFISMKGPITDPKIKYDGKEAVKSVFQDLKQEKKTLKQILRDEFKWNKGKDSAGGKNEPEDKFILENEATPQNKKKKEEELDDSDDF